MYIWVDGVYFNVRLEDDRLCTLAMIGVRPDGTKELITVEDGHRESAERWKTVLRDLTRRGMRPPVVAVGDGALGFWAAVRGMWPKTREQRGWFHKLGNIVDKLPKRLQPRGKVALHEMMNAETRDQARDAITQVRYRVRSEVPEGRLRRWRRTPTCCSRSSTSPSSTEASQDQQRDRVAVRDGPAAQRVTKGAGSRTKGLVMAYKLLDMAQARWRPLDGAHLLPLVRAGIVFVDGVQKEGKATKPRARAA